MIIEAMIIDYKPRPLSTAHVQAASLLHAVKRLFTLATVETRVISCASSVKSDISLERSVLVNGVIIVL